MARTTSTQHGASRRTTRSVSGGQGARGASSRSRKPASTAPSRAAARPASRSRARRPAGPWVPIAIVALVAVLAWALYPALRLEYQASRSLAGLDQQYASLKERTTALRSQVAALRTPQGVEQAARKDLGYAKSGDNVYVVVPSGQATSSGTGSASVSDASLAGMSLPSLLQSLLDAIFGVQQPSSGVAP